MQPMRPIPLLFCSLLVLFALSSGGCLVTSHSNERHTGNYVSDETLRQIEPGKTTAAWIRSTLGAPTKVDQVEPNVELWKYSYTVHKDSSGTVFLIFAGDDSKESHAAVFVELKDGIVRRTWRG